MHPALEMARAARLAEDPLAAAPPHEMWALCGDGEKDLYSHAMEEAGHVHHFPADGSKWTRHSPCYYCGWAP